MLRKTVGRSVVRCVLGQRQRRTTEPCIYRHACVMCAALHAAVQLHHT